MKMQHNVLKLLVKSCLFCKRFVLYVNNNFQFSVTILSTIVQFKEIDINSFTCLLQQLTVSKEAKSYYASLEINNVTVEDAGKYRVTAKNELGESNATISLNFDSKYPQVHYKLCKNKSTEILGLKYKI